MDFLILLTVFPAYLVASFFIKNDPGPEEPQSGIRWAVGFGFVAIVLAIALSLLFEFILGGEFLNRLMGAEAEVALSPFADVLVFASIEELVKFVPIAIYLLRRNFFNEITDGIIYFAIVGLTFGAVESLLYALGSGSFGAAVAFMRLALALFFHGALTAIVGYFFARARMTGGSMISAVIALAVVSVVHALYNYSIYLSQNDPIFIFGAAAMALSANAAMFWLFFAATKQDIVLGRAGPQFKHAREMQMQQRRVAMQQQIQMNQAARAAQQANHGQNPSPHTDAPANRTQSPQPPNSQPPNTV